MVYALPSDSDSSDVKTMTCSLLSCPFYIVLYTLMYEYSTSPLPSGKRAVYSLICYCCYGEVKEQYTGSKGESGMC